MKLTDLSSRDAVLTAISEFDEIGRKTFLNKYHFGQAQDYFLVYDGRLYDSKAILGAAFGYEFPDHGPFHDRFNGGDQTINVLVHKLGFEVTNAFSGLGPVGILAAEINQRASYFKVGHLQELRAQRLGHKAATKKLFSAKTVKADFAFHSGGREELQFNIGLEDAGASMRFGVAFSLEITQTLPEIEPLKPIITRFNRFIRSHSRELSDLRMWVWEKNGNRSTDYPPREITDDLIRPDVFIFLGDRAPLESVNADKVLELFDRMLPVYQFVEGGTTKPGSLRTLPKRREVLSNEEIAERFGVGVQGGMRRNRSEKRLVLISDPFKGLYKDRWDGNILHYTGMGPIGPQSLTYSQNKTLTQSAQFGTTLHLLEALSEQKYTYVGEVSLAGPPYQEEQPDRSGTLRPVWMFPLQLGFGNHPPEPSLEQVKRIEASQAAVAKTLTLEQLKALAAKSNKSPTRRSAESQVYDRNAAVAELTKRLANGICDLCLKPAPFLNKRNEAYLECHHIHWLAQGGDDAVANTVALCPNCHRKMHILNSVADRNQLQKRAEARDLN